MTELPAIAWDVSALELVAAVVMFGVGYATHEAMHIGALEAMRIPYSVEILPDGLKGALIGTGVQIDFELLPSRWRVAVVMLAPIIAAVPPLVAYAVALMYPVLDIGVVLVLFAWFAAAIPGLHDIVTVATYDPAKAVPAEVAA